MSEKNQVQVFMEDQRAKFEDALAYDLISGHLAFQPFMAAVLADVSRTPKLMEAFRSNPGSFFLALQSCAQMKLLPGGLHGQYYLIPRTNKGVLEVNGQVGYKGLCAVSKRHKRVHSIEAFLVYKGEEFSFDAGAGKMTHKVNLEADHGEDNIVGGYMKAIITEEASHHAVLDAPIYWPMSRADIIKRRNSSDAYRYAEKSGRKDSPWHLWAPEMWRKTVLIGGLNHGSVPQDLGVGGMLTKEAEDDRVEEPKAVPKPTQGANIRATLGLDKPAVEITLAEEAVEAIRACKTIGELEALRPRIQNFKGMDTETVGDAYAQKEQELS